MSKQPLPTTCMCVCVLCVVYVWSCECCIVCMCMCLCIHEFVSAYACGTRGQHLLSSCILIHQSFFETGSLITLGVHWAAWPESCSNPPLFTPPAPALEPYAAVPDCDVGSGDQNEIFILTQQAPYWLSQLPSAGFACLFFFYHLVFLFVFAKGSLIM